MAFPMAAFTSLSSSGQTLVTGSGPIIQHSVARATLAGALQQRSLIITANVPPALPTVLASHSIVVQQRPQTLHPHSNTHINANPNLIYLTSRPPVASDSGAGVAPNRSASAIEADAAAVADFRVAESNAETNTKVAPPPSFTAVVMPPPGFTSSVALSPAGGVGALEPLAAPAPSGAGDERVDRQRRASHASRNSQSHSPSLSLSSAGSRSPSHSHSHSRSPSASREHIGSGGGGGHSHSEHRHRHHRHHHHHHSLHRHHSHSRSNSQSQSPSSQSLSRPEHQSSVFSTSSTTARKSAGTGLPLPPGGRGARPVLGADGGPVRRLGRGRPPGSGCKKEPLEGLSERTLRKSAQVALAAIALSERSTDSSSGAQIGLKELIATQSHGSVAGCATVAGCSLCTYLCLGEQVQH